MEEFTSINTSAFSIKPRVARLRTLHEVSHSATSVTLSALRPLLDRGRATDREIASFTGVSEEISGLGGQLIGDIKSTGLIQINHEDIKALRQ